MHPISKRLLHDDEYIQKPFSGDEAWSLLESYTAYTCWLGLHWKQTGSTYVILTLQALQVTCPCVSLSLFIHKGAWATAAVGSIPCQQSKSVAKYQLPKQKRQTFGKMARYDDVISSIQISWVEFYSYIRIMCITNSNLKHPFFLEKRGTPHDLPSPAIPPWTPGSCTNPWGTVHRDLGGPAAPVIRRMNTLVHGKQ